jgi:hypothetical protein
MTISRPSIGLRPRVVGLEIGDGDRRLVAQIAPGHLAGVAGRPPCGSRDDLPVTVCP